MKTNQPTKIPYHFPPHFFRHCLSAGVSILVACLLDVVVVEKFKPKMNHKVVILWSTGQKETIDFQVPMTLPVINGNVELGFDDTGVVHWRYKN